MLQPLKLFHSAALTAFGNVSKDLLSKWNETASVLFLLGLLATFDIMEYSFHVESSASGPHLYGLALLCRWLPTLFSRFSVFHQIFSSVPGTTIHLDLTIIRFLTTSNSIFADPSPPLSSHIHTTCLLFCLFSCYSTSSCLNFKHPSDWDLAIWGLPGSFPWNTRLPVTCFLSASHLHRCTSLQNFLSCMP